MLTQQPRRALAAAGPRECQAVVQLEWHPRPYPMQLLSLGGSGNVYIWTKVLGMGQGGSGEGF